MQGKTTMRYHLTPVRRTVIKKSTNNKCRRGCGEKRILLRCLWECKLVRPLWKIVWRFLRKLKVELYDPAILLLGILSGKTIIQKDTCTCMFIATLFTVTKTWKQLNVHRQMNDKENMAHMYNGILVGCAKGWNNVGMEQWLHGTGATSRRYPISKGKGEAPARWYEGRIHG